jgi:hypothetical protein
MNAITLNFADATGGMFADAQAFLAADEATRSRAFKVWRAHDDKFAGSFRDHSIGDFMQDQVGRAFLTPQLHRIETEVYMTKYPSFDLNGVVYVNEDGDMWDVGTVFYSMDQVGKMEFMSGKGFDMPYAGASMNQFTRGFHLGALGYEYTTQEMERAAKLGRSLSSDKALAANKGAEAFKFWVALTGRGPGETASEKGWTGLINDANVPTANFAADGTGSSRLWSTKTPDQISRDFWEAVNAVETATGETHVATTALLPTSRLRYLETTRMTDTGTSILAYILGSRADNRPVTVRGTRALETAGASSTARMVAYDNSREVAQFHLPADHTFLPPYQKGSMTWEIGGLLNTGGTEVRIPKAMAYRDGL